MVEIDLSGISTFIPVFGFLLVFVVVYALLGKTKVLGENKFVHILVSFAISIIFLVSANAIEYVRVVTPWFATFIVSLLFIVLVVGLIKGNVEEFFKGKGFAWLIIIALIIIFLFSAVYVFADLINKYLGAPKEFFLQPTILGVIVLVGITILASWLLTKK
ncbi:MAG: hypothetical protein K6T16_00435 [Candidatus Pacearchaeota archaeon]|nr:hypothetical protein [Candidatus Pacearchaeota archaeon]